MQKKNNIIIAPLSQFEMRLPLIQKFITREGHAQIPIAHREDGQPIGYWCSNWRFRIETAINTVPRKQVEALRQIGFLSAQPALFTPAPVATGMAELFSTPHDEAQAQPAPEDDFGIFETWLKSENKPQQQETWVLPVSWAHSAQSEKPLPKVVIKKRRRALAQP